MKRVLVFIAFLLSSIAANAQIDDISIEKETWHFVGRHLLVDNNVCYLLISSDNQFETTLVKIKLGSNYETVTNSLDKIISAIEKNAHIVGAKFTIQRYTFSHIIYSESRGFYANVSGEKLLYTAGSYKISIKDLKRAKEDINGWINGKFYGKPSDYGEIW